MTTISQMRKMAPATESQTIRGALADCRVGPWGYHSPMIRRLFGAAVVAVAVSVSCSTPRDPIIIDEGIVTVENQTSREWRNVKVTVNDHFNGASPVLAAGGR